MTNLLEFYWNYTCNILHHTDAYSQARYLKKQSRINEVNNSLICRYTAHRQNFCFFSAILMMRYPFQTFFSPIRPYYEEKP